MSNTNYIKLQIIQIITKKNIVKIKIQIICNARRIKNQLKPTNISFLNMVIFLWYETEDACTNTLLLEIMWEFLFKLPDFYSHIKNVSTHTTFEWFNFYL